MTRLSTVAAFGFDDFDPPVILDLYRQLGCTSCQFYRNPQNPPAVADAVRIANDAGLPIDSMHGLFGDDHDPSSTDDRIRRTAIETYRAEGELARTLVGGGAGGAGPMVVVHPSPFAPKDHDVQPAERACRIDPLRRSMAELARIGEELGVVYLFENNPNFAWIGNDPIQVADLIREVESPHIRMCFDAGHANMTGAVAERMALCADVIAYLHIHDNDGRIDNHQLPSKGNIDWSAVRRTIRGTSLDVFAMIELFYSADELREFIRAGMGEKLAHWLNVQTGVNVAKTSRMKRSPGVVHSRPR